jgi:lambda family phage tail tape measure protein
MSTSYQAAVDITARFTGKSATDQAAKSLNEIQKAAQNTNGAFELASKAFKAYVGVEAISKVAEFGKSIIALGDELFDLKQKTGIGVEALASLKTAAELGGVNFEDFEKSLKKFSNTVGQAEGGSRTAGAGFKALGISLNDSTGSAKTSDKLLAEVADKFAGIKDGAGKAAISVALFGKTGTNLIPVLNEGSASLTKYGAGFTSEFAANADAFHDSLVIATENSKGFAASLLNELLPALTSVVEASGEFQGKVGESSDIAKFFGEAIRVAATVAVGALVIVENAFDTVFVAIQGVWEIVKLLGKEFYNVGNVGEAAIKLITGDFDGANASLKTFYATLGRDSSTFLENSGKDGDAYLKRLEHRSAEAAAAIAKINPLGAFGDKVVGRKKAKSQDDAPALHDDEFRKQTDAIDKFKRAQEESFKLGLEAVSGVDKSTVSYKENIEALKIHAEVEKSSVGFTEKNKAAFKAAGEAAIDYKNQLIELEDQNQRSFGHGASEAIQEYGAAARNVAAQTKGVFQDAFKGMEDALVNFVKTGKLNFSNLADAIETDLIRIAARQALVAGISAVGSAFAGAGGSAGSVHAPGQYSLGASSTFANGGIMSEFGSAKLSKYASGGVANSPQVAVFGEGSRPEAYVPLPDGRNIPVKMTGGSGGGGSSVVVNVNIANSGQMDRSEVSDSEKGKAIGRVVSDLITDRLIKERRPGGLLAS